MKKVLLATAIAVGSLGFSSTATATGGYYGGNHGDDCGPDRQRCDSSRVKVKLKGEIPCLCRFIYDGQRLRGNAGLIGTLELFNEDNFLEDVPGVVSIDAMSFEGISLYCNAPQAQIRISSANQGLEHEDGAAKIDYTAKYSGNALELDTEVTDDTGWQSLGGVVAQNAQTLNVDVNDIDVNKPAGTYTDVLTVRVRGFIVGL